VKSTARLFGDDGTARWMRRFLVATVVLLSGAAIWALVPVNAPVGSLLLALGAAWALGWHLAWQLARLDTTDPARCLRLFRSNRDAGLIAALFLAAAAVL
jgi:4-hydroxybenzoate polyprenyltransferase